MDQDRFEDRECYMGTERDVGKDRLFFVPPGLCFPRPLYVERERGMYRCDVSIGCVEIDM